MPPEASRPAPGPLGPLALSLSGGGYRAATFHLGSLRLLDQVGLLSDVVGLSTVSGGTLTGLAWVVSQLDGKPFAEFHAEYSAWLKKTNVIADALEELTADREHESHNWASLIRSAADVYARPSFLNGRKFGEVLDASGLQFQELIFNSTEFHTGTDFRFRRSDKPNARLGNNHLRLPSSVARQVQLADVAAASSCFPGGFEPLVFPQQFHWSPDYPLQQALQELGPDFQNGLPLMDGGIFDNQGIASLLLAFDGAPSPPTLIISDVSTQADPIYDVPAENPTKRGWVTLNGVSWMGWGLFLLTLASALCLGWRGIEDARTAGWHLGDAFVYIIPGLLTAAVAAGLVWARLRLEDVNALLRKQVDINAWPSFRKLTVLELAQMLTLRTSSMLALTSKIFMKRVRGLVYHRVYADPAFQGKRMSNLIYALMKDRPALFAAHPWMKPGPSLVKLSEKACGMPTTLWFTSEAQYTTLETAGAATLCYVLLRHILETRQGQYETPGLPLHDLYQRLRQEWARFNAEATPAAPQHAAAA